MLLLLIGFLAVSFFARFLAYDVKYVDGGTVHSVTGFGIAILIMVSLCGGAMTTFFGSMFLPTKTVANDPIRLETMNLGEPTIEGRFFLGTGHISTDEYYVYRFYEGDRLRDGKVIRYDDYEALVYLIRDQEPGSAYLVTYRRDWKWDWEKYLAFTPFYTVERVYEFHVPVNSIVPSIDIQ